MNADAFFVSVFIRVDLWLNLGSGRRKRSMIRSHGRGVSAVLIAGLLAGCGEQQASNSTAAPKRARPSIAESSDDARSGPSEVKKKFQPVQLGDDGGGA